MKIRIREIVQMYRNRQSRNSNNEPDKVADKVADIVVDTDVALIWQQQRLLLLHHASECKYGTTENPTICPATQHCAEVKQLWKHIIGCTDPTCPKPHCVS